MQAYNRSMEEQIAAIRAFVIEKSESMSSPEAEQAKSPASFADFSDEEKDRILAFHKTTIEESIQNLTTVVSEDGVLEKLYDSLFFTKPKMLLRELATVPANMQWSSVPRLLEYSVDGIRGPDGAPGACGDSGTAGGGSGTAATDGMDAQAGTSAGSMKVSLISVPNQNIFLVTPQAANPVMLPLFDSTTSVQLSARGGDGGDGGAGGKGGDGSNGMNGQDATPDRAGTSGTNGK